MTLRSRLPFFLFFLMVFEVDSGQGREEHKEEYLTIHFRNVY